MTKAVQAAGQETAAADPSHVQISAVAALEEANLFIEFLRNRNMKLASDIHGLRDLVQQQQAAIAQLQAANTAEVK
jgi:hypothetical protein